MKRKLLISGAVAIISLSSMAVGAYAGSSLETISAYLNHGLHIQVNGTDWKPSSDPITYDGSTYLPVRSAAEAIGVDVGYDDATQTVKLNSTGGSVSYAFTQAGDHPEQVLVNVINEAKENLDIAIYSITLDNVVQAILDAKERGVNVRIISDATEARTKYQSEALSKLSAAGIPIKINTHSGLMHLKVTIVDNKVFTTGSFNYSKAASTTNDEVLLVDRNASAAAKWDAQFERMWNDTSDFTNLFGDTTPTVSTAPETTTSSQQNSSVTYSSCKEAEAAGVSPLHRGDPGYSTSLDRDGDGVACEN